MEKELFPVVPNDRQHRNSHLNKGNGFFFTARKTEHWNRLPRKIMESPSLEISKTFLDMVQVGDFAWTEVLDHLSVRGPFQLQVF